MGSTKKPLRIAWFSTLNSALNPHSIAAYTTDTLLPHLNETHEIELFHNSFESYSDIPTYHYLRAFERHREDPYDVFFYQVEDGQSSHFTRFHLALIPGVVLFHDLLFVDSGPVPLYVSPWEKTVSLFNGSSIEFPRRSDKFDHEGPFAFREASLAGVPVFSTEHNHVEFKRNVRERIGKNTASYYLPHPVSSDLCHKVPTNSSTLLTIAYCGTPQIEHRAHKFLLALSQLKVPYKLLWLTDETERAASLLTEFGVTSFELVTGRSPTHWAEVVGRADVAVHALFSAYSQPGPYLPITLMSKVPALVTNYGAAEYLSDRVVAKITPGETEAVEMEKALVEFANPELRESLAVTGRNFAEEFHDSRAVASELANIFKRSQPLLAQFWLRSRMLHAMAHAALLKEAHEVIADSVFPNFASQTILEPTFRELQW